MTNRIASIVGVVSLGTITSCGVSSQVFALPMRTPTGEGQGDLYTLSLSTEGSAFSVWVDTGSSDTALAGASCANCLLVSPLYSPGAGATDTGQQDEIVYASGATWAGEVYSDTVRLGDGSPNVKLDLVDISTEVGFFYFAQDSDSAFFQGILGLGRDALLGWGVTSFMDAIAGAGVARKIGIEMCQTNGTLWLGGLDASGSTSALQYTPLVTSRRNSNFYSVGMTAMALDGVELGSASDFQDPIVDTGTSFVYVPDTAETSLIAAINNSSTFQTLFPGQTFVAPTGTSPGTQCVGVTADVTNQMIDEMLPPLKLTFDAMRSGDSIAITAPALESYLVDSGAGQYCLAIYGGANDGNVILGDTFLRGFTTEIDIVNNRVGFAPTGCPMTADSAVVTHRMVERGRGPSRLAEERDRALSRRNRPTNIPPALIGPY